MANIISRYNYSERTFSAIGISCSYDEKDFAKSLGCKWNANDKTWNKDLSDQEVDQILKKTSTIYARLSESLSSLTSFFHSIIEDKDLLSLTAVNRFFFCKIYGFKFHISDVDHEFYKKEQIEKMRLQALEIANIDRNVRNYKELENLTLSVSKVVRGIGTIEKVWSCL